MTPEKIDAWLTANERTRPWLAAQLGISVGAIYNSFSKGFSARTLKSIEALMNPPGTEESGLEVTFTAREFERIEEARKLLGIATRKLYYEEAIAGFTDQVLTSEAASKTGAAQNITYLSGHQASSMVAEDPPHA